MAGRAVRRPDLTVATEDHNVPTTGITGPDTPLRGPASPLTDPVSRVQVETLRKNCADFGIRLYPMGDAGQGIVHVIGPQQGLTQPGLTIVCGDSHTSTHGAFGALAFGIGTSEVGHVLATQTLPQARPADMAVNVTGELPYGVTAKDLILAVIAEIGTGGGTGHVIEYRGDAIAGLSMEGRMTVCNMSIEAGARAGLIAPDETTFRYLEGRPRAPQGAAWDAALEHWRSLPTDPGAVFDREVTLDAAALTPFVTWGTNPAQAAPLRSVVPDPATMADPAAQASAQRALAYMDLAPGTALTDVAVDTVFVGSCTNGRLEDLRAAAEVLRGKKVAQRGPDAGRARLDGGQGRRRAGGPGQGVHRRGRAMAVGRLLDVPGHEPGHDGAGRAQRIDLQPQLRGPAGRRRPHAPGVASGRRRHGGDRQADRAGRSVTALTRQPETARWSPSPPTPAAVSRCGAATLTPTRSSPPST